MRKTKRISFLMVPNLYFSLFWFKNEIFSHYDKSSNQKMRHSTPLTPLNTPITPLRLFHSTSKPTVRPSRPLNTPPSFQMVLWGFDLKTQTAPIPLIPVKTPQKKTSVAYGSPYLKLDMKLNYRFLLQLDIWVSGSKASMTIGNPSWVPLVSRIGAKKAYQMLSIFWGTPPSQNTT